MLAILARLINQEVRFAAAGVPMKLGVPALLLQRVNVVGDPGKLILP